MSDHRHGTNYIIPEARGKAIQEILHRYVNEELRPRLEVSDELQWSDPESADEIVADTQKDINYIESLAEIFD